MKVKQKLEKPKGKKGNILRGPKVPKKMKLVNILPKKKGAIVKEAEPVKVQIITTNDPSDKSANQASDTLDLTPTMVKQGVQALLQLHEEFRKNSKTLILNDKENILLQMVFMRKPEVPEQRRKYIKLPHSIYGGDPEVCLFVTDRKSSDNLDQTPDEKIEFSVDYYEEFLKNQQVEGISTIMPSFQFRTEYDSYELRRKLVDRFDLFLCQSNLLDRGSFLKNLGIAWSKKNKVPLAVKFPKKQEEVDPKFKEHVSVLLKTTWFWLKPHGDTVSIRVGNTGLSDEQLAENVSFALQQLKENNVTPGGVANIKSLLLKTSRSKAIPLYINLASPNSVPVPVVPSLRDIPEAIEDELSTLPGKRVTVLPSGDVFVMPDPNQELIPEWQEELTDEENDLFDDIETKEKSTIKKTAPKSVEESDDSDNEGEEAEQKYLATWNKEADDEGESSEEEIIKSPKKKTKGVKSAKKLKEKGTSKAQEKKKLDNKKMKKTPQEVKKSKKQATQKAVQKKLSPKEKKKTSKKNLAKK